jgi:signal transduction histidine kinase
MVAAVMAAVLWPSAVLDGQMLASVLAVLPALLLAHYRRWTRVSVLLGCGIAVLCTLHFARRYLAQSFDGFPYVLMLAPYLAIALGAGWFGEVRRYRAELRAAQLQLIQSEKLDSLGRMAAGVAHEVKNPLMTILTGVKILSKRLADADDTTRTLLADMTEAVSRADKIIGGLLSYSRERELDLAPADLNATIDASLRLVKHELDKARIEIAKDLDPSLPSLRLDEFKLQQVFVNLLTNALHAMGQGGTIELRTVRTTATTGRHIGYRQGDRFTPGEAVAMVQLDDSGPGIPEEHLSKIFDPFFTTKPTGVGTGLGLSVCQQIVDMHGGTIEIGNRAGGGARVTMFFKIEASEHSNAETTNPARR